MRSARRRSARLFRGIGEIVERSAIAHHVKALGDSAVFAATWQALFEAAAEQGAAFVTGSTTEGSRGSVRPSAASSLRAPCQPHRRRRAGVLGFLMMLDRFRADAAAEPDALAVAGPEVAWSRSEAEAHIEELAGLLASRGMGQGDRLLVGIRPAPEFVVAVLAAWSLGASVVPINLDDPPARLSAIVEDTGAEMVVTIEYNGRPPLGTLTALSGPFEIAVTDRTHAPSGESTSPGIDLPTDEAYVIFTSGSTGRPKGVSVSHRALASYLVEAERLYVRGRSGVVFPFQRPVTFDAAVTSWGLPLFSGGVCHAIGGAQPSWGLAQFLRESTSPCVVKTTPGQLRVLGHLLKGHNLSELTVDFVVGGEQLTYEDCAWAAGAAGLAFHNEYGPTEATVGCIIHSFHASSALSGPVPIGHPHHAVVLHLEPRGADDDLFRLTLSGQCLADGYLGSANGGFHEVAGERRYTTGDLVRRHREGALVFVEREDEQVKLGGHRVELGEVGREAGRNAAPGARLVALKCDEALWLVVEGMNQHGIEALTRSLQSSLPRYMWPRGVLPVSALPMNAHGKTDKRALTQMLRARRR